MPSCRSLSGAVRGASRGTSAERCAVPLARGMHQQPRTLCTLDSRGRGGPIRVALYCCPFLLTVGGMGFTPVRPLIIMIIEGCHSCRAHLRPRQTIKLKHKAACLLMMMDE